MAGGVPLIDETKLIPDEIPAKGVEDGIALCLSGGGYRAMLFHLGSVLYLNERGYLPRLARISTVSGGSILGGLIGARWNKLTFRGGVATNFQAQIVEPIRTMASTTIDVDSILGGIFSGRTISEKVTDAYEEHLYGDATLQDFPDEPRIVINATNVQSGVLMRFSKPYIWDYRVGKVPNPSVRVAQAVTASSAFPPFLSPARLQLGDGLFEPRTGKDLQHPPFTEEVVLTDGGVYDNLGMETVLKRYKTVLVSDGGGQMQPERNPKDDWLQHSLRINSIIDNQVRCLRKRQLISSYESGLRSGTYWGIRGDISRYSADRKLAAPHEKTIVLAEIATRLQQMPDTNQKRLINWGYAITDAAMRTHVDDDLPVPMQFPYEEEGVG